MNNISHILGQIFIWDKLLEVEFLYLRVCIFYLYILNFLFGNHFKCTEKKKSTFTVNSLLPLLSFIYIHGIFFPLENKLGTSWPFIPNHFSGSPKNKAVPPTAELSTAVNLTLT